MLTRFPLFVSCLFASVPLVAQTTVPLAAATPIAALTSTPGGCR